MRVMKYDTRQNKETLRPYLIKELSINYPAVKRLDNHDKIAKLFCDIFDADLLTEEKVWFIGLDSEHNLLGIMEVSRGYIDGSLIPTREILMKSLMINAPRIVLVHNHPSGDPTPSSEDIEVTDFLKKATEAVGIHLVDHVVIGHEKVFSFFERCYL